MKKVRKKIGLQNGSKHNSNTISKKPQNSNIIHIKMNFTDVQVLHCSDRWFVIKIKAISSVLIQLRNWKRNRIGLVYCILFYLPLHFAIINLHLFNHPARLREEKQVSTKNLFAVQV